ncbi:hypothetical protein KSS87_013114 [Heliosperma pusillum]|nr:hypothetical protein KSS87_013114 [Heliosperma pusillum]
MMGKSWLIKFVLFSVVFVGSFLLFASANEETVKEIAVTKIEIEQVEVSLLTKVVNFLWQGKSGYVHVWPEMKFGWEIIVGSLIGFFGAAFGSVGGVGGGGIFVPMLTLIIGFDSKSSTAMSKCMIMGAAVSTVYYNLKQRHPTLEMPVIDYDLALLFQPMLVLGISIGVAFNVIFADWMITVLLIILFIFTSTKAFLKGVETWKKETIMKKEAAQRITNGDGNGGDYKVLPAVPNKREMVPIMENVHWPQVAVLCAVWLAILGLEIAQKYTSTCSIGYWMTNLLQVSSATATFAMMFSSSMSVVEYYLLNRFPVSYGKRSNRI